MSFYTVLFHKKTIPNKINEGIYQYLANIFMCNIGAGVALALLEKANITEQDLISRTKTACEVKYKELYKDATSDTNYQANLDKTLKVLKTDLKEVNEKIAKLPTENLSKSNKNQLKELERQIVKIIS